MTKEATIISHKKPEPVPMSPGRKVLFWASMPLALFFMLGGILASPLDKHRHSSLPVWLLYTVLRFAVPGAILGFCAVWLFKHFFH
jgi:hypothetical protein